jgi:hypothetical protein
MKSDQSADELRKLIEGFLALAKLGMGNDSPKEAFEMVDSIKIVAKGAQLERRGRLTFDVRPAHVTATMHLKTASMVKLAREKSNPRPAPGFRF